MTRGIVFEKGEYGDKATITTPWEDRFATILRARAIAELELNQGKGWKGADVSFLHLLPHLRALTIMDFRIPSVAPIHELHELRRLHVETYCKTPIEFQAFPLLVDCGLEWRAGSDSLFDCVGLRRLFVDRFAGKTFDGFARLASLESLTLLGGPLESLSGIGALKRLGRLRLGDLRRLQTIDDLEGLDGLAALEIQVCKRITSIAAVGKLKKLKRLLLTDCGDIESLSPISGLDDLEEVLFSGSTRIVDGDLTPLEGLRNLKSVSFQNRRHYSHRREEFGKAFWG